MECGEMQCGDGTIYVKSPHPLLAYAVRLTERLEYWAGEAADRTFLAQRTESNEWRKITYAETLQRVRAIAQALTDRRLTAQTPVLIVSGNGIEHALLALGCMYAGVPYAPLSPSYLRGHPELTTHRFSWKQIGPALVFAYDGETSEAALCGLLDATTELVTVKHPQFLQSTSFDDLVAAVPGSLVDSAHAKVNGDTVAKIMFTSGSTGTPKGVITTQRMLCSNQQMIRSAMSSLLEEPPVLCDWLPWSHVFGGSHNFGLALYNGGTLFIDEGKPTPSSFETTLANLRDVPTTAYFNVPRGYRMLLPHLRSDMAFRRHFFSRLKVIFCAGASLHQSVWDEMQRLALETRGEEVLMMNALGSTESAPMAVTTGNAGVVAGRVGWPVPGVELKLVPTDDKLEARLRGPNITPGYWHEPEQTALAVDDEGFYKTGDALRFVDADRPQEGFCFDGRLDENFKLSTGTWVNVNELRTKLLSHLPGLATEVVLAGPDRDYVTALIFSSPGATCDAVSGELKKFAVLNPGLGEHVQCALLIDEQPSWQAGEMTDKGIANQRAVLCNRAALIDELYSGSARVINVVDASPSPA